MIVPLRRTRAAQTTSLFTSTEHIAVEVEGSAVDRRSEAEVALVLDDTHLREALGDRLGRTIGRCVVDDDNVRLGRLPLEALERPQQPSRPFSVGMTTQAFITVDDT